jgi:hypothetical protein
LGKLMVGAWPVLGSREHGSLHALERGVRGDGTTAAATAEQLQDVELWGESSAALQNAGLGEGQADRAPVEVLDLGRELEGELVGRQRALQED